MDATSKWKKGVAYARFSSDNQREESIEAQIRAIKYYAQNFGIDIVHVYADRAKSGKTDDRPQFQRMIDDSKSGNFELVLVHKLDRFSRNPTDTNYYEKVLNDNGVQLLSVLEKLDDSPEGQLMKQIIIGMNSFYSANLAREVRKGLKENALNGKFTGGIVNFGYKIVDGRYEIHEQNAEAVRKIFDLCIEGAGKVRIAKILNEQGYKSSKGNYFAPRTIYDILKNQKYIGIYTYNIDGEIIVLEDAIPAIIDYETWLKAQEELSKINKAKYREQKRQYYLTGKMHCGECGGMYSGGGSKGNKYGATYHYYICNKTKTKTCNNKGVNKERIENLILDEIGHKILSDDVIEQIADEAVICANKAITKPTVSIDELKKQEKQVTNQIDKLMDLYIDNKVSKDVINSKVEKKESELKNIKAEIRKATQLANSPLLKKDDFVEFLKSYRLDTEDEELAKSLIRTFVDKVIVYNDRFEITFKIDFDALGGKRVIKSGAIVQLAGALRTLSPLFFTYTYPRKFKNKKRQK